MTALPFPGLATLSLGWVDVRLSILTDRRKKAMGYPLAPAASFDAEREQSDTLAEEIQDLILIFL